MLKRIVGAVMLLRGTALAACPSSSKSPTRRRRTGSCRSSSRSRSNPTRTCSNACTRPSSSSGAHLYGFPSPDSDYYLRGVHVLPVRDVTGLFPARETVESSGLRDGLEIDLVTHDVKKFMALMLKKNGYVLEQLLSPLVVHTTPAHEQLMALSKGCVTRHHAHHYLGFAETQWKLFEKDRPPRVKPLLYVYRVLLTGIHLMRTGDVEASLVRLNETFRLPYVPDLVARKLAGPEKGTLRDADLEVHRNEYARLRGMLEAAYDQSTLPDVATAGKELNDLLVRVRSDPVLGNVSKDPSLSSRAKRGISE